MLYEVLRNELQTLHERLRHHKIMIVDDEPLVLEATRVFLGKFFDEVYTAKDGQEALELFERTPVDIIFTDIRITSYNVCYTKLLRLFVDAVQYKSMQIGNFIAHLVNFARQ